MYVTHDKNRWVMGVRIDSEGNLMMDDQVQLQDFD